MAIDTPVTSVMRVGAPLRLLTTASDCGSRPSRAMVKKIRLWPYIITRMTEGSAMTAAVR